MNNDALLKPQKNSAENTLGDIAEVINKKIDEIQALLNDKQQQGSDKNEEIAEWTEKVVKIINTPASEEDVLKNLEEIHKKIQEKTEIKEKINQTPKEIPIRPNIKQEALNVIHASERGIPVLVSNTMKKTAENLGVTIETKDKPKDVIEKLKRRLRGEPIFSNPMTQEENITPISPEKAAEENQRNDKEKVIEIKKQIDTLLGLQQKKAGEERLTPIPEIEKKEENNIPKKTRTVSDQILAKLG